MNTGVYVVIHCQQSRFEHIFDDFNGNVQISNWSCITSDFTCLLFGPDVYEALKSLLHFYSNCFDVFN